MRSIRYITLRGCLEFTWPAGTLRYGDVVWVDAVATQVMGEAVPTWIASWSFGEIEVFQESGL